MDAADPGDPQRQVDGGRSDAADDRRDPSGLDRPAVGERVPGWRTELEIKIARERWALELRGPQERRADGSWFVTGRFTNATPDMCGPLEGTLRWDLLSVGGRLGLVTERFDLSLAGETFKLDLKYQRPLVSTGISAKGSIVYADTREQEKISFSKYMFDEVGWLRMGGPHRLRLGA